MTVRSARVGFGVLAAAAMLVIPLAALGSVEGPCDGSVEIAGETYTPANDSPSNPIVIPDDSGLVAEWEGTTDTPITDHSGSVGVVLGPGSITIATWTGENADQETSADGAYEIDEARGQLPVDLVGLYEVEAQHSGQGGSCSGTVMILLEGSPITNPIGVGSVVGAVATGIGLAFAGRRR